MRVSTFMAMPPAQIEIGDSMDSVMKLFDTTGAWNLPVVEKGHLRGICIQEQDFQLLPPRSAALLRRLIPRRRNPHSRGNCQRTTTA